MAGFGISSTRVLLSKVKPMNDLSVHKVNMKYDYTILHVALFHCSYLKNDKGMKVEYSRKTSWRFIYAVLRL
jgi:hypothetical protein